LVRSEERGETVGFGIWRASGTRWRDLSVKATGFRFGPTTRRWPRLFSSYYLFIYETKLNSLNNVYIIN
jgi:hypothetical protein